MIVLLWPVCRWYGQYKQTHWWWWLRHLLVLVLVVVLVLDRVFQVWRQLLDASRDIAWPRIGLWDPWDLYEISSCRLQSHPFEDEDDDEYEDES